ncbi:MAG TPA: metallophosphoesterase family protein, partial [Prolixibacteraceae bacterium]|nr:metallophosphoesterase family protein [Prolixibacteraceae bacterium]
MIKLKFTLVTFFIFCYVLLWGADLKISWKEGKDNLYNHPARLHVTSTDKGNGVANATIFLGEEALGKTDSKGYFSSSTLNQAAVKFTLKACIDDKCSDKTSYQVLASEYPFPTYISMGDDPSGSMSFTWHTNTKIKVSVTECVRADDKEGFTSQQAIRSKGITYLHKLVDVDKPEGIWHEVAVHKTTIRDLAPDTRYKYRVGDGKYWREGSFLTAPEKNDKKPVKFLFVADSQESSRENYQSILKSVLNKAFETNPDIRFVMHAGDMVNRGMNGQEWGWFYEAGEKYFRNFPFAPIVGNHEAGGVVTTGPQQENSAYLPFFNNPSNQTATYAEGSAYSFNYGAAHLLCLDIQNLYDAMDHQSKTGDGKYLESAIGWIKKDLADPSTQGKWKIVTMHQPIYGANRNEEELRKVIAPVFDRFKVDLVITGHDHYYFRSFPMRYDSLRNDGELVPM